MSKYESDFIKYKQVPLDDSGYLENKKYKIDRHKNSSFGLDVLNWHEMREDQIQKYLEDIKDPRNKDKVISGDMGSVKYTDYLSSQIEKAHLELKGQPQVIFKRLVNDLGEFFEDSEDNSSKINIGVELVHMFKIANKDKTLGNDFGGKGKGRMGDDLNLLVGKVLDGELSDKFLLRALKARKDHMQRQEILLEETVEETKIEFKNKIYNAVKIGIIPENALGLLGNVDNAKVTLLDQWEDLNGGGLGNRVACDGLQVNNDLLRRDKKQELKHVLYHEFMHTIAGKSVDMYHHRNADLESKFAGGAKQFKEVKNGLSLSSPQVTSLYRQNRWLNEGATELLVLKIFGENKYTKDNYQGSEFYINERRQLNELFEKGLKEETVFRAYFESVTRDQPKGEKRKFLGKLIKEINRIEGPGGYVRLNNKDIMSSVNSSLSNFIYSKYDKYEEQDFEKIAVDISVGANANTLVSKIHTYTVAFPAGESEKYMDSLNSFLDVYKDIYGIHVNGVSIVKD